MKADSNNKWLWVVGLALAGFLGWAYMRKRGPDNETVTKPSTESPSVKRVATKVVPAEASSPRPVKPARRALDPALNDFLRKDGKDRVTGDLAARIPFIKHAEDIELVVAVLEDVEDEDTVRNEAASLLRRSKFSGLTNSLISVLQNPKEQERFRSFVVQHLYLQTDDGRSSETGRIRPVLHACLKDRHVKVRREAVLGLMRMGDPVAKEQALAWLRDESKEADAMRDLAIRIASKLDLRDQIPTIRAGLKHSAVDIRIMAMVALSYWDDEVSRGLFEEAAKSTIQREAKAAKACLIRMDKAEGPIVRPATNTGGGMPEEPNDTMSP